MGARRRQERCQAQYELALNQYDNGHYEEAVLTFSQALNLVRALKGPNNDRLLANILVGIGNTQEARQIHGQALVCYHQVDLPLSLSALAAYDPLIRTTPAPSSYCTRMRAYGRASESRQGRCWRAVYRQPSPTIQGAQVPDAAACLHTKTRTTRRSKTAQRPRMSRMSRM